MTADVPSARLPRIVLRELTPSEAEFQRRVLALARALGWRAIHHHSSKFSERGFPDVCMVRPPRLVFCELKVWPNLVPSPFQAAWLADLGAVPGVECYVWAWVFGNDIEAEIADILGRDAP